MPSLKVVLGMQHCGGPSEGGAGLSVNALGNEPPASDRLVGQRR